MKNNTVSYSALNPTSSSDSDSMKSRDQKSILSEKIKIPSFDSKSQQSTLKSIFRYTKFDDFFFGQKMDDVFWKK